METTEPDPLHNTTHLYSIPCIIQILTSRSPLNPNGKVDKPNLPFPDIAEQTEEASDEDLKRWESMSETERLIATNWANLLPGLNPKTITPQNDFFDLGGHSLLAQQMLLNIRRETNINVSINMLYEHPSLAGFSTQLDRQLGGNSDAPEPENTNTVYSQSLNDLLKELPSTYQTADPSIIAASAEPTVFLTGATGFLGSYIIKDLLERTSRPIKLIAHVRGVKNSQAAFDRLRQSLQGYGIWKDEWSSRLSCVVGDLSKRQLGIAGDDWEMLSRTVDVVINNGAAVHWVKRYQDMMSSNVLSTIDAMELCNTGKPKTFAFVSSTSVLDTDHYVKLSDQQISTGRNALSEEDDMEGSRIGLGTGYGQTKWVSEQLAREAGRRGLTGSVIRPG